MAIVVPVKCRKYLKTNIRHLSTEKSFILKKTDKKFSGNPISFINEQKSDTGNITNKFS